MDSEIPPGKKVWSPRPWLVLGLAALALLVALLVAPFAWWFGSLWWQDVQLPRGFSQERWAANAWKRHYLAEDLISKRLLIGKSREQCSKLLGAPDATGTVSDYFPAESTTTVTEGTAENTYVTMTIPGATPDTIRAYFNLGPTEPIPETFTQWVLGPERSRMPIDSESLVVGFNRAGIAYCAVIEQD